MGRGNIKSSRLPSFLRVLYTPQSTFAMLKNNPCWISTYISNATLLTIAAYLQYNIFVQVLFRSNVAVEIQSTPQALQLLRRTLVLSILGIPLMELAKILFFALIITGFCYLSNWKRSCFRDAMTAVCHCRIIVVLRVVYNTLLLFCRGITNITGPKNFHLTGINIFFELEKVGMTLYTFLIELNIFSIWYIVLMTMALHILFSANKGRALIFSLIMWIFTVLYKMAVATMFGYVYLGI